MLRDILGLGVILETQAFADGRMGWREASRRDAANRNAEIARKNPELSAFALGAAAAKDGLSPSVNPFHYGHPSHEDWRLGWVSRQAA